MNAGENGKSRKESPLCPGVKIPSKRVLRSMKEAKKGMIASFDSVDEVINFLNDESKH